MARRPSDAEWNYLHYYWRNLVRQDVWILGERTTRYNCLAWALGYTDRWIWPWGSANASPSQMSSFLHRYGYSLGTPRYIGTYGTTAGIGHAARFYVSSPSSKLGGLWLITHLWAELNGGSYGNLVQSYRRGLEVVEDLELVEAVIEATDPDLPELSGFERQRLRDRVSEVDPAVKSAFEDAYGTWRKTWDTEEVALDSTGYAVTARPEFLAVVKEGGEALPLLMEKLLDPDEHFALRAVERILPAHIVPHFDPEDEEVLKGEQYRARLVLSNWLLGD
jgi:hypothetical protein